MERLNSKLCDKYKNLKKRKDSESAEWNAKTEADFRKYQTLVEGAFEELKNENDQLRAQISSTEESYNERLQKLMEENQKIKERAHELEKLCRLLSTGNVCSYQNGNNEISPSDFPTRSPKIGTRDSSEDLVQKMTPNSRIRQNEVQHEGTDTIQHDNRKEELVMPYCCRRNMTCSGDGRESDRAKCVFQTLVESLVGMKFSLESQTDGLCLSVIHQSTGYSFSLSWLRNSDKEVGELLYCVSSLGTLERVALEWMKEDLVFSTTMCHVFFERISKVIGRHQ